MRMRHGRNLGAGWDSSRNLGAAWESTGDREWGLRRGGPRDKGGSIARGWGELEGRHDPLKPGRGVAGLPGHASFVVPSPVRKCEWCASLADGWHRDSKRAAASGPLCILCQGEQCGGSKPVGPTVPAPYQVSDVVRTLLLYSGLICDVLCVTPHASSATFRTHSLLSAALALLSLNRYPFIAPLCHGLCCPSGLVSQQAGFVATGPQWAEINALLAFKHANLDPQNILASWRASPEDVATLGPRLVCRWAGVGCTKSGKVQSLQVGTNAGSGWLLGNGSVGQSLPPDLGKLTSLVYLDLSYNALIGGIPDALSRCTALSFLNLNTTLLSGPLPSFLGHSPASNTSASTPRASPGASHRPGPP